MNEALRQHVTRVGFDLTLGKTHVAALVYLDFCTRNRTTLNTAGIGRNIFSWFVPGIRGCGDRGLVVHHYDAEASNKKGDHLGKHYTITPAGKLVIGLLKEAGIWQEYEAALPVQKVS